MDADRHTYLLLTKDGTFLNYPQAPMERWILLASEEAQLRMGIPKYLVDAEKAKNDAIQARGFGSNK